MSFKRKNDDPRVALGNVAGVSSTPLDEEGFIYGADGRQRECASECQRM